MYSLCFKSHTPIDVSTFLTYLHQLHLGRIARIHHIPNEHFHLCVHFSWFRDETLRTQLDSGIPKFLFIWPNGNPTRGMSFEVVKTTTPSDMIPGLPLHHFTPSYECQII
jgi:hypothetical protein